MFVRYQAAAPNARGTYPGIFALCNGLARSGSLRDEDMRWWRASNDAMQAAYVDPGTVAPAVFDRSVHPEVSCWFKATATPLIQRVGGYLALLDRYGVEWVHLKTDMPGRVLWEDSDQVVVEPFSSPA